MSKYALTADGSDDTDAEIRRVCSILESIASQYPAASPEHQAIADAATAFTLVHQHRALSAAFRALEAAEGGELSLEMLAKLRSMGIEPDELDDADAGGPPSPQQLIVGLQKTLSEQGIDYERIVSEFGQVAASEARERGQAFSLSEHIRGLLLSQLSNQRPWGAIAANLAEIQQVFLGYDPDALERADPAELTRELCALRCGNRAIAKQLQCLAENIRTLRQIASDHGSVDAFVTSGDLDAVARQLSRPGRYKLRHVGYTLALEYLRNVGIRAAKPDVHVRRVISGERLGVTPGYPSEEAAQRAVAELAAAAGCNPTYLDNLLWLFCAKDYGNVCRAEPRCGVCAFRSVCNYPRQLTAERQRSAQ